MIRPLLVLLLLAGCAGPAAVPAREEMVAIPQVFPDGTGRALATRICRPATTAPHRIVVINHGASPGTGRPAMQPQACDTESARWFTDRGFIVLFPLRRGYGATGGALTETSDFLLSEDDCGAPDYIGAGFAGAQDIDSAVQYGVRLPDAAPDQAVVVGQSTGGWAVLAFASKPHPRVAALIAMAPGRGGWADGQRGHNCRADLLAASAAYFGRTATTPVLWVTAANDSFYPPPVTQAMIDAYRRSGGQVEVAAFGPFATEGHALFQGRGGSAVWGPAVLGYLAARTPAS